MRRTTNLKPIRQHAAVIVLLVTLLSGGIITNPILGQAWQERFASPSIYWTSIASSADGTKLVAVGNSAPVGDSAVYTSTNSGANWVSNAAPLALWTSVASSTDGNKLVAVAATGAIWTSTNSGAAWIQASAAPSMEWRSVASSSDGAVLVAAALSDQVSTFTNGQAFPPNPSGGTRNGGIFTSTDSGATWFSNSISCNGYFTPGWESVASSADGMTLAVGGTPGLYISLNGSTNWTQLSSPLQNNINGVALSADGTHLLAAGTDAGNNYLWIASTNSGLTWTTNTVPPGAWYAVACSADGTKLATCDLYNPIFTSTDSGNSWLSNSAPVYGWIGIASSADGSKLATVAWQGEVYTWQYRPELRLDASDSGGLVLSWRSSPFAAGFIPQTNGNLSSGTWADITAPISDDGTNQSVVLGAPQNVLFFRLKK